MIEISSQKSRELLELIKKHQRILIISHRNPDPDTIGSNLALRTFLKFLKKDVVSVCIDLIKPSAIIPEKIFQTTFDPAQIDLIITVDVGSSAQIGFTKDIPEILDGKIPLLNLDHHASNDLFGSHHLVFPEAASATLVLFLFLRSINFPINPQVATWLLYGLYYDTGSFMHSNTTAQVYEIAAELQQKKADMQKIIQEIFHHHTLPKLKLWGKIFEEATMTSKNIIVAGITDSELKKMGVNSSDISGAIDYLSMVKANNFAAILSEDGKGNIRGSIRTKENDVNLSEIAGLFGGGGHRKASGFTVPGKLEKETLWRIAPPSA